MARSINEIYQEMVTAKEQEAGLKGLTGSSTTSVWRLLFYVVAVCVNTLEKMFDSHKAEVDGMIADIVPGKAEWYARKTLAFMKDKTLETDTDEYDTAGMDESEIESARVVKHAVAVESGDMSGLTIKVAGEDETGERTPLDEETETQLRAYLQEIKYAGVKIELVNREADRYMCNADVWYDPQLIGRDVQSRCEKAIKDYVENLPFNGEYTNMALTDALQAVEGVKVAELRTAQSESATTGVFHRISAREVPDAGYYKVSDNGVTINMMAYEQI